MARFTDDPNTPKFAITQSVRYTGPVGKEFDRDLVADEVRRFIDNVVWFEELGYDMATITEHHFGMFASLSPSPHLALAAAAVLTKKIQLATAVTVIPFRSPLIVAEEAILLDNLSRGRFELGIGRGGAPLEITPFGIDRDELNARWTEGVEVLDRALKPVPFKHESALSYANVPVNIAVFPPSYQNQIPIWVGSTSLDSAKMAGSRGYNLMRNLGSAQLHAEAIDAYLEAAQSSGQHVTAANCMVERFIACSESEEEAAAVMEGFRMSAAQYAGRASKMTNIPSPMAMPQQGARTEAELVAAPTGPDAGANLAAATAGRIAIGTHPPDIASLFVTGTPKMLTENFEQLMVETGCNRILIAIDDQDRKTVKLMAEEVLPKLRNVRVKLRGT